MEKLKVTNDYVFKRRFWKQGNESILKDFLIAVLELPIEKIEIIKDAHLDRSIVENKSGILDIKATLNNKITVNIEMHFIQIPKCKKEDVKTKLDKWVQFIGNISKEGVDIAMKENEEIRKAQEELEYLTGDEED